MRASLLALVLALCGGLACAVALEPVKFASLDGTQLSGLLLQPAKPAQGTVIALHGCGGLYATAGTRKGQLNARHQAMADMLLAEGYNVLLPDSLGPRGESEICTQRLGSRQIDQTQRRADALGALSWAAGQPWAVPERLALLGWSHGGSAVLSATDANHPQVKAQTVRAVVAIAFYPGCTAALRAGYRPDTRLALLLGEKDDWTPPGPCIDLGHAAGAEVIVYPDSYHDFDNPVGEVRLRLDVPNGVKPGHGVHAGRNPVTREQAYARLREILRAAFR